MITNTTEIMNSLMEGNQHRSTEPTAANEVSSRSHAVLTITVENREKGAKKQDVNVAKFNFIDLAGSE